MEWQPMETAPKDGTKIFVTRDNACGWDVSIVWWHPQSDPKYPWACSYDDGFPEGRLDYWMPLPQPPKETNNAPHISYNQRKRE